MSGKIAIYRRFANYGISIGSAKACPNNSGTDRAFHPNAPTLHGSVTIAFTGRLDGEHRIATCFDSLFRHLATVRILVPVATRRSWYYSRRNGYPKVSSLIVHNLDFSSDSEGAFDLQRLGSLCRPRLRLHV